MQKNSLGFQGPLLKSVRKEENQEVKKKQTSERIQPSQYSFKETAPANSLPKAEQLDYEPGIQGVGKGG